MRNIMGYRNLRAGRVVLGILLFLVPAASQDRRIAIYDFNSQSADLNIRGKVPPTLNLGHQVAVQLMTELVNSPTRFEVIERGEIERILKEQGRKYDERFDPASAPELGRLLNVDGIILGDVDSASATVQGTNFRVPIAGTQIGGKQAKAKVHISARLISTQTGTIQVAQAADGDASESVSSSISGVSSGTQSDEHTAMGDCVVKAIDKAVANVSASIVAKSAMLPKIVHPAAPTTAGNGPAGAVGAQAGDRVPTVNSVDGATIYIEGGQDLKLAVGDRYDVRQVTKVLKLSTGPTEVRERVETLVIDDVQPAISIAHVEGAGASRAKTGDTLVKATSLPPILQGPPPAPATTPKKNTVPGNKMFPPGDVATRGQQ